MTQKPPPAERLFRLLVRLLPTEFKGDFGEAMTADVGSARYRGAAFWWREIRSLVATIAREHFDALRQDVKYALRMMQRTPAFTAVAVLMLALGTGVNVAMFSIVDAVLLRSPFEDPGEIAAVRVLVNDRPTAAVPLEQYRALAAAAGPLSAVGALTSGTHVLTGQGDPLNVDDIECVSPGLFDVLRTRPVLGRTFGAAEDQPGAEPTIVLSHAFWRHLGSPPDIVGRFLTINQAPVQVVGVMPPGFAGPLARGDVQGWMPRNRPVKSRDNAGCRDGAVNVFVRVRPDVSIAAAQSALLGIRLAPLESEIVSGVSTPFTVLMIAVACVLLIACINVGGLQMERTLARRREMALRLALGASRGRLVRQTLTENVLLAIVGAAAGIVAASITLNALVAMLPPNVPYLDQIEVNGRVLIVTILTATAAGLTAGLLPIAQTRHVAPARDLTDSTRASEPRGSWARRTLVVIEIALSIVVLIGASLMVQTFLTLRPARPGFDSANKIVMPLRLRGATPQAGEQFFQQVLDRLRTTPTVRSAEGTTYFPMSGNTMMAGVEVGGTMTNLLTNYTTPGFLPQMRVSLVAGRFFSNEDRRDSLPVMIVNQVLADRMRPDGRVLGERVRVRPDSAPAGTPAVERTIVGVIGNMRSSGVDTRARGEAYIPFAQSPGISLRIVAEAAPGREAEVSAAMRSVVRELQPDLVVNPPASMDQLIRNRMGATPFGAWLLGVVAMLAVVLAAIGLAATIGWWVRQRTQELGVRIALGASRAGVSALVFRQGMTLAAIGVGFGCLCAAWLMRYLAGWIYGVTPLDPVTFAGSAGLMLVVAALAVYVPVRRATSIDPVTALRAE